MESKGIGVEGFKKIFELKDELKKDIENHKNKKTMIYLKFIKLSKNKKEYNKLRFPSLNKVISIDEKNSLDFEYINNKFSYKNKISELIILYNEEKEQEFLINIKRHHDNYYTFFIDIEIEKVYSLEIVFYFKNPKDKFESIIVSNTKIEASEIFPKTIRYNLINISKNNFIKLFDEYSDNKINQLNEKQQKELFSENSLFINFIYGNDKRIGKIFCIKKEKEIEDFNDEEKIIIKKINEIVSDEKINKYELIKNFESLKENQNYKDKKGNYLKDLNEKFEKIPFFLKYYDKNPTSEDIKIIRGLSILNILLFYHQSDWVHYLKIYIKETENIFKNKNYLNNKDKIMILLNYLTIIKDDPDYKNYQFESFYELEEESFFIKSELFYRDIISKINEDSSLFFLYLQLNSGSDIDYTFLNPYYKIKHISLIEIKTYLLTEYFYHYFFTFLADKELIAWNDNKTQVKNYSRSIQIFSEEEYSKNEYIIDNTVKLALIKFNEYVFTKFKEDNKLLNSPRYLLLDNLNYLDSNKKINDNKEITEFLEGPGQEIERYIFGEEDIVKNIIYSKEKDLSKLYNSELFIQNNFNELNKLVEEFKTNFNKKNKKEESQETRLENNSAISIPKLPFGKDGKVKIYTYYDLGISSTDLLK